MKLQKANLFSAIASSSLLMEDKINDEKLIDEGEMRASVDTGSTLLGQTQESLQISVDMASKQSADDVYE